MHALYTKGTDMFIIARIIKHLTAASIFPFSLTGSVTSLHKPQVY